MSRLYLALPLWVVGSLLAALLGSQSVDAAPSAGWERGLDVLERRLPAGQVHNFYRDELIRLGYMITAVTYDDPGGYASYQVVKDGRAYVVHLDLDRQSSRARHVMIGDVTTPVG
jgi:hypothetical protein